MRHLLYPTRQIEEEIAGPNGVVELRRVWLTSCSCGFRELHSTRDDALRATAKHDMSSHPLADDGETASEPGDDYRTSRQADDA